MLLYHEDDRLTEKNCLHPGYQARLSLPLPGGGASYLQTCLRSMRVTRGRPLPLPCTASCRHRERGGVREARDWLKRELRRRTGSGNTWLHQENCGGWVSGEQRRKAVIKERGERERREGEVEEGGKIGERRERREGEEVKG